MAEVRLKIADDVLAAFRQKLGPNVTLNDIAREALTMYNWATDERRNGRAIMSATETGSDPVRLVMPGLDRVQSDVGKGGPGSGGSSSL